MLHPFLIGIELFLAITFIGMGVLASLGEIAKQQQYVHTQGTVIQTAGNSNTASTARVRFMVNKEEQREITISNVLPARSVGDKIIVLYNPHNPHDAHDGSFSAVFSLKLLIIWLGVFFLTISIGSILFKRYVQKLVAITEVLYRK